MKNVQVIDGASNCTIAIFPFEDRQFSMIFPRPGQNIAFIDEALEHLTDAEAIDAFAGVWERPVQKSEVDGLHGTLFYEFEERKRWFPVSRRECDWDESGLNPAQRQLNLAGRQSLSG